MKWFHGAIVRGRQRAAIVVATSRADAKRLLDTAGFRHSLKDLKDYWSELEPGLSKDKIPLDSARGIYVASDMNYPREYKHLPIA